MVTGAQISEYKREIVNDLPSSPLEEKSAAVLSDAVNTKDTAPSVKKQRKLNLSVDEKCSDHFPCEGITCSYVFVSKTNLRSSLMRRKGGICRRCTNMNKAILFTNSVESALNENPNSFRLFYDFIAKLDSVTIDDIIDAVSKIVPLPNLLSPTLLKRATKRNMYPIAIINMVRLLAGTFKWSISTTPTSIDKVFNQKLTTIELPTNTQWCICKNKRVFFAIGFQEHCPTCDGVSSFLGTSKRIDMVQASSTKTIIAKDNTSMTNVNTTPKNRSKNIQRRQYSTERSINNILRDITNLSPHSPLYLAARPDDTVLNNITRVNNMLSNFVVSYFFKLPDHKFQNVLYQEFLFDFVKRDGGWRKFVQYCRRQGNYSEFLAKISQHNSICIIPICFQSHWTILIRRFIGHSWKIFFVDSIEQGSAKRFQNWKALFLDDDLFAGEWIKAKICQQTELECGARVCLHGVCFALSKKNSSDIINDLKRFKDLAVRSRMMVSHICKDGFWSPQKWLSRTIGSDDMEVV
jgi:hypothetical protein